MTEAACGGGDLRSWLAPGRSGTQISMGLCFSWELFLPIKYACVCMRVERYGELFSFKKKKKSKKIIITKWHVCTQCLGSLVRTVLTRSLHPLRLVALVFKEV